MVLEDSVGFVDGECIVVTERLFLRVERFFDKMRIRAYIKRDGEKNYNALRNEVNRNRYFVSFN